MSEKKSIIFEGIGYFSFFFFFLLSILLFSCSFTSINKYTKRIFFLFFIFTILQLPYYLTLSIKKHQNIHHEGYSYSFKLLGPWFYLTAIASLCLAWGDALKLQNFEQIFETKRRELMKKSLQIILILFLIFSFLIMGFCIESTELDHFFDSIEFDTFIIINLFMDIIICSFIIYVGRYLRLKLKTYCEVRISRMDNSISDKLRLTLLEASSKLLSLSQKLIFLVIISIISIFIRDLGVYIFLFSSPVSSNITPYQITKPENFAVIWFFFEFLPDFIPPFLFCLILGWPIKFIFPKTSHPIIVNSSLQSLQSSQSSSTSSTSLHSIQTLQTIQTTGTTETQKKTKNQISNIEDNEQQNSTQKNEENKSTIYRTGIVINQTALSPFSPSTTVSPVSSQHNIQDLNFSNIYSSYHETDCFYMIEKLSIISSDLESIDIELNSTGSRLSKISNFR